MAAYLAPIANAVTFFTAQGVVLSGGKINTYLAGTTTPAATYTDSTQATPNSNPIILGSNGVSANEIWLPGGVKYKFVYTDSNNNVLGTYDNLSGINDPTIFSSSSVGTSFVRGLVGNVNAGTPLTKFDISTISTTYQSASSGVITDYNTATITVDLTLAGPIANGRDQAAVFPASNWIHIYKISNGTTSALIASLSAPTVGPSLPSGYVYWAYATTIRWNSSSNIIPTLCRGAKCSYPSDQTVLAGGSATVETSVSVSTFVPPNALRFNCNVVNNVNSNASGTCEVDLYLRAISGQNFNHLYGYASLPSFSLICNTYLVDIPNVSQSIYYIFITISGGPNIAAFSATITVSSYVIPNGDS